MGFLSNLFNKIFKRKEDKDIKFLEEMTGEKVVQPSTKVEGSKTEGFRTESLIEESPKVEEPYEPIDFPEGEIMSISDGVLDTNSRVAQEKLKHNLKILVNQAREKGKIDKFMMIREDYVFPDGWEWRVSSKDISLSKQSTVLSSELRKAYALEQSGKEPYVEPMGMKLPRSYDETKEALSKIDKTIGNILLPSRFFSTKHFTVNTPLGVTGDYNGVSANRDYVIMDDMNAFLNSGYAYSVAYHDAYLDVSHESLPISENAVVLINDEKYEKLMQDAKIAAQLAQRKVIRFKGDETIAIDMVLSEMGVLPSQIGFEYAEYDKEIRDILKNSMKELAEEHDLFFDRSHAGDVESQKGHFSDYYDDKNPDNSLYSRTALKDLIDFFRKKFPENDELFPEFLRFTESDSQTIIQTLGTKALLSAIDEYNELAQNKVNDNLKRFQEERKNISPEIHNKFVSTVALINNFYKGEKRFEDYADKMQIEGIIQKFFQSTSLEEQLQSANAIWEMLPSRAIQRDETSVGAETITMRDIVTNALQKGVATEHIVASDKVEDKERGTGEKEAQIDDK